MAQTKYKDIIDDLYKDFNDKKILSSETIILTEENNY